MLQKVLLLGGGGGLARKMVLIRPSFIINRSFSKKVSAKTQNFLLVFCRHAFWLAGPAVFLDTLRYIAG